MRLGRGLRAGTVLAVALAVLMPAVLTLPGAPTSVRGSTGAREAPATPAAHDITGGGDAIAVRPTPQGGVPPAELNWTNQTSSLAPDGLQPGAQNAGLAFDPATGDMVFYGGKIAGTPTNSTWAYNGDDWTNLTSNLTAEPGGLPPAVYGMGFAWDPSWGGILMTGGALANGSANDQTWLYNATGWHNETGSVSNPSKPRTTSPNSVYAVMAYDDALGEMVSVDGCSNASACSTTLVGQTFALGAPGGAWTNVGPTFTLAAYPGTAGTGDQLAQMAYDPALKELVFFGGESGTGYVENFTWTMDSSGWSNSSSPPPGCTATKCFTPPPTAAGGMTWDGQLGTVVLAAGLNRTHAPTNNTSLLTAVGWKPCGAGCTLAVPTAESDGEMASNSTDVAALLIDGACPSAACSGDAWVFEVSPGPMVSSITPAYTEVGVPVDVEATNSQGTATGPVLHGTIADSAGGSSMTTISDYTNATPFDFSATLQFSTAGTYTVTAQVQDFFGVTARVTASTEVSVNGSLAAAPQATPNPVQLGTAIAFSAGAMSGTGVPPFLYDWSLGDGNTSSQATFSHTYGKAATFDVSLVVTDHLSVSVRETLDVTVYPKLAATVTAERSLIDAGVPDRFTGGATGGTGTYTTFGWAFGDGNTSSEKTETPVLHFFSKAGSYTVTFTVNDSAHFSTSAQTTVRVNPALSASVIHVSVLAPTTGTAVVFNLTVAGGTPNYSYAWNFGNGAVSTDPSPTYAFASAGTYTVVATIHDDGGGSIAADLTLTVAALAARPTWASWLSHGIGLYTFVAALAAAAFLLVVVLLGRRRRGRTPAPSYRGRGADDRRSQETDEVDPDDGSHGPEAGS